MTKEFTMKHVADVLDVHRDTIQYWEEHHLIPMPRRNPANRYRVYSVDDIMEIARARGYDENEIGSVVKKKLL